MQVLKISFNFSSMAFLSTKGLRVSSWVEREFFIWGGIWGESTIRW